MTYLSCLILTAQAQVCSLLQLLKYLRACRHNLTQTLTVYEALCEVPSLAMYLHLNDLVGVTIKKVKVLRKAISQLCLALYQKTTHQSEETLHTSIVITQTLTPPSLVSNVVS